MNCNNCHFELMESEGLGYNDTTPGLCANCDWAERSLVLAENTVYRDRIAEQLTDVCEAIKIGWTTSDLVATLRSVADQYESIMNDAIYQELGVQE